MYVFTCVARDLREAGDLTETERQIFLETTFAVSSSVILEDTVPLFSRRLMLSAVVCTLVFFSPAIPAHSQQAPAKPKGKVQMAQPAPEPQVSPKSRANHNGHAANGIAQPQPGPISQLDPALMSSLKWRNIGPYRGGR